MTPHRFGVDNYVVEKIWLIIGPTAVGKGSVGRRLAERIGGQIVSADSMKVYRRMDIGTAKPSPQARRRISHWCIDIVEPWENFSVAQYVEHADEAIAQIRSSGAIPLVVGGTSLYVKALTEGLFEAPSSDSETRRDLNRRADEEGLDALHEELSGVDPEAAGRIHPNDRKRVIRALEVYYASGKPISRLQQQWEAGRRRYQCTFIALRRDKTDLNHRINARAKRMVRSGLVEEVASLLEHPRGLSPTARKAVGYSEMIRHLRREITLTEALEKIKINTRRLARKQLSWQRRFESVRWFDLSPDEPPDKTVRRIIAEIPFQEATTK